MIKILIACKTGVTTNLLVQRMEKVIKSNEQDISIKAVAETEIANEYKNYDMVLVGPQISASKVKEVVGANYLVQKIAIGDYTTVDAENVIEKAIAAYKELYGSKSSKEMSILIACTAGVSSELVVDKINKVIKEKELNVKVKAVSETEITNKYKNFDVLLVAPQISVTKVKELVGNKIPVEAIKTGYFTTMNGEAILNQAINLYNNK